MAAKGQKAKKTFVLDTSVLLADPGALYRFAEHEFELSSPVSDLGGNLGDEEASTLLLL